MASMRTYGDGCGVAHALDIVGERWALLVVRDLLLGPKRFTDLRTGLRGASPNVLAQRLRELEEAGIVRRRRLPPPAGSAVYELTDWGRELEPILIALGVWGVRSPSFAGDAPVGMDSVLLALRTSSIRKRPRASTHATSWAWARAASGSGSPMAASSWPAGRRRTGCGHRHRARHPARCALERPALDDALRAGDVRIEGDRRAVDRFLGLFPQPEPGRRPQWRSSL